MERIEPLFDPVARSGLADAFFLMSQTAANSIHAGDPLRAVSAGIVAFSMLLAMVSAVLVFVAGFAVGPHAALRFGSRLTRAGGTAILAAIVVGVLLNGMIGRH